MSFFPAPYVGRFHHGAPRQWGGPGASYGAINDIAPFFRVVDAAIDSLVSPSGGRRQADSERASTFQPRFDVKESEDRYELRGELPGVEATNVEVKFADENTLVIKGKTESEKTSGTPPSQAAVIEGTNANEKAVANDTANEKDDAAESRRSSTASYVKPTVEDEADVEKATGSTATATEQPTGEQQQPAEQQKGAQNEYTYWYSERSTGSFQRTFTFPTHIDQDGVIANLKNGVLDVVLPKRKVEEGRKISVGDGA